MIVISFYLTNVFLMDDPYCAVVDHCLEESQSVDKSQGGRPNALLNDGAVAAPVEKTTHAIPCLQFPMC